MRPLKLQSYPGILGLENAECVGTPLGRQLIHYRAAWIGQSDEFGHLVEGLSRGIVKRLTQHAHVVGRIHTESWCVPRSPSNTETEIGRVARLQHVGEDVARMWCTGMDGMSNDQAMALANDVPTCNDP